MQSQAQWQLNPVTSVLSSCVAEPGSGAAQCSHLGIGCAETNPGGGARPQRQAGAQPLPPEEAENATAGRPPGPLLSLFVALAEKYIALQMSVSVATLYTCMLALPQ